MDAEAPSRTNSRAKEEEEEELAEVNGSTHCLSVLAVLIEVFA